MKHGIKLISVIFAVLMILSTFSILSFAADKNTPDSANKLYTVEFISSLDEKEGTVYLDRNTISIYKIDDNSKISEKLLTKENLYTTIKTDENGSAKADLELGTYIVKEDDFKYKDNDYEAELLSFKITEANHNFVIYIKHVKIDAPTTTKPVNKPVDLPFTGQTVAAGVIAGVALICGVVCVVVLTTKKKKDEEPENNENNENKLN